MKNEQTLIQLLAASGYAKKENADGKIWSEMASVWEHPEDGDGTVTDADIDDFLGTLVGMHLIEKVPEKDRKQGMGNYQDESGIPSGGNSSAGNRSKAGSGLESILVLSIPEGSFPSGRITGSFTNPDRGLAFEADDGKATRLAIVSYDLRFREMFSWLGSHHVYLTLTGRQNHDLYFVSDIRAAKSEVVDGNYGEVDDNFLSCTIGHILTSEKEEAVESLPEPAPSLKSATDIRNFMGCAAGTLPYTIRQWAYSNIALLDTDGVNEQEKQHAMRALSLMLNVHWKSSRFQPIDPVKARKILDEELYGLGEVKQRVIETIIQINRTRTLPSYGLLLAGPAGTGKSRIAYAVAEILKIPYTVFDMSTVSDPEALTGTSRIYSNARPGRIMEAFSQTGSSNLVFIINELDKADSESSRGSSADTLLTLLDNLGYTDNYMECQIPTNGVYPIATANDINNISKPLLSRFSVIRIPDYTPDEKAIIFRDFSLPRVLKRMGMSSKECLVTPDAVHAIVDRYRSETGCRDLEQAAEHIAGNALYRIETEGISSVTYDADTVRRMLA